MLMYPRSRYDDAVDESETDDVVVDVSRMPFPPIDNRLPPYRQGTCALLVTFTHYRGMENEKDKADKVKDDGKRRVLFAGVPGEWVLIDSSGEIEFPTLFALIAIACLRT